MLGSSTHTSLVYLMNKPLLLFSYKDTSHTFTRCIIVDTKLLSWSDKANTQVLLWPLGLLQTLAWGYLIQTNLKASPVALSTSCWSWINLSWTSKQNSLKLWVLSYILEYHHASAAHSDFHCANSNVWYFILPILQLGYPLKMRQTRGHQSIACILLWLQSTVVRNFPQDFWSSKIRDMNR